VTLAQLTIRNLELQDLDEVVELQASCFPPPFPAELLWQSAHLARHLEIFPAGQWVAVESSRLIASSTTLIIGDDLWHAHADWETTVGGHELSRHDPSGTTLYGVDISVHPKHRGQGVGRALFEARIQTARGLGLTRFGTACRLPGLADWHQRTGAPASQYVEEVLRGGLADSTLTPLLRWGLKPVGILDRYMEDEESRNSACLLELVL